MCSNRDAPNEGWTKCAVLIGLGADPEAFAIPDELGADPCRTARTNKFSQVSLFGTLGSLNVMPRTETVLKLSETNRTHTIATAQEDEAKRMII